MVHDYTQTTIVGHPLDASNARKRKHQARSASPKLRSSTDAVMYSSPTSFCSVSIADHDYGGTTLATIIPGCTQQTPHTLRMQPVGVPWHTARRLHVPSHAHGRDSAQGGVVPRRQGPWVPSLSRTGGLWGPSPWCNTHAGKRVPFGHDWQLGLFLFGMPARGPSRPLRRMAGSRVAAPFVRDRRPLTHSPRREAVSGPAHTQGAHPAASGRFGGVALFKQSALLS